MGRKKSGPESVVNSVWNNWWFKLFAVVVILLSFARLVLGLVFGGLLAALGIARTA